jgi:hypothetical protein
MSSTKYFNYCPYFIGVLWKSCGKDMWIILWKTANRFWLISYEIVNELPAKMTAIDATKISKK